MSKEMTFRGEIKDYAGLGPDTTFYLAEDCCGVAGGMYKILSVVESESPGYVTLQLEPTYETS